MIRRFRSVLVLALPAILMFALVACGGDDEEDTGDGDTPAADETQTEEEATETEEESPTEETATETEEEETATEEEASPTGEATAEETGAAGGGGAATEEVTVETGDIFFEPKQVTIPVGGTVVWEWTGELPHDVVSEEEGLFDSGILQEGTFEYTFEEAGTYDYLCEVHPDQMTGTIEVTES